MNFNKFHSNKAVALIIVIFAMLLFAVLGWTLAIMQSTDFEANLRNLDSERALGLAEAGANWTLRELVGDPNFFTATISAQQDSDCSDSTDWRTHSLSPGQYQVCCRLPTATEEAGRVIESEGYMSWVSNYRAMRKVKLLVKTGSLTNALQTQVADAADPQKGLFNWYPARSGHWIGIEGNIEAGHYEGDGDGIYDELGEDYDPPPPPLLPPDILLPRNDRRVFTISYPSITSTDNNGMKWFYNNASNHWPDPSTRTITADATVEVAGSRLRVAQAGFFRVADRDEVIIRRTDVPATSKWDDNNWTVITNVANGPTWSRADVSPAVSWPGSVSIILVKRFYQPNYNNQNWYIGGQIDGGTTPADTLIDVRNNNVEMRNTSIISEGDIVIKGLNRIWFRFTGTATRYPNLATKDGDIISIARLEDVAISEFSRRLRRRFAGLIYSEFGHVNLNYLTGTLVYGSRITLDGRIYIRYQPNRISPSGFVFSPRVLIWQEQ
jgi:hypothetical protein